MKLNLYLKGGLPITSNKPELFLPEKTQEELVLRLLKRSSSKLYTKYGHRTYQNTFPKLDL